MSDRLVSAVLLEILIERRIRIFQRVDLRIGTLAVSQILGAGHHRPLPTTTTSSSWKQTLFTMSDAEYKEAFALFDKKGTGTISRESLGDLLRALGQNPTQAEVADLANSSPKDIDYSSFLNILNRPNGFKPAGTPEEFIRGFQVFDKDGNGFIGAGELRYVLTSLGEKLSDDEMDELLKGVQVHPDGNIHYESFVRQILSQ